MFSEELRGNATRKRAEENRARRRQFKEQQAKLVNKTSVLPAATGSSHVPPTGAVYSFQPNAAIVPPSVLTDGPLPAMTSLPKASVASPLLSANAPSQLSAVERAEQQRLLRANVAKQIKAAITVQSFARGTLSFHRLRAEQTQLLERRLQDLGTLRTFLQSKSSDQGASPYVPPPATATALVQQLLLVSRPRPSRRITAHEKAQRLLPASVWSTWLVRILEFCILPAIDGADEKASALLVWMESVSGRLRLKEVMRLAVVLMFSSGAVSSDTNALLRLVEHVLGDGSNGNWSTERQHLVQYCRSFLLMKAPSTCFEPPRTTGAVTKSALVPSGRLGASLDLISNMRYHLMFAVAGSLPIPHNAKDLRDQCVPAPAKGLAGVLFSLILDGVDAANSETELQLLHNRVVVELFTVPLLPWKLCPLTVTASTTEGGREGKARFLVVLRSFVELHAQALATGALGHLLALEDVPLTLCPATPSQCLLANLVQLSLLCPALNGTSKMNVPAACDFFTFVSSLLDVVPLSTFSSRDSSVEWMTDGKGHHTPIVLSSVVLEQCRLLLLDSFVRRLMNFAIRMDALNVDSILALKTDRDIKHEKNFKESGAALASSLAAKEARIDRNRSFWDSSKWASKISKGVSSLINGTASPKSSTISVEGQRNVLMDTSSVSRKLARGVQSNDDPAEPISPSSLGPYEPELLYVLCRMYAIALARWGGGGRENVGRRASDDRATSATATPETCTMSLLNVLGFSTPIIPALWAVLQTDSAIMSDVEILVEAEPDVAVRSRSLRPFYERLSKRSAATIGNGAAVLFLFVSTLAHVLIVTDDVEIHDMDRPLPIHQLRRCVELLKRLLYRACYIDDQSGDVSSNYFGLALTSASSRAMRDLYDRSSRRPICVPKLWLVPDLFEKEIRQCKAFPDYVGLLTLPVLRVCPFLVSFKRRLKIFERIVTLNRIEVQGVNDMNPFNSNPLKPGIPVRITRGRLLEDGLLTMNHLGSNMRRRIAVQYVNEAGVQETGVDAGGLFKEFWTDLSGIAFDPNYALFRVTEGAGNCLYPNPSSGAAHGTDHIVLFEFLGRILGKALYEGITIRPCFAHFFLSFLRGDYNYLHMLPDLGTIDPQLYNNLMFLKTYDGDAADLCLTFTITNDEFGGTKEIPLIPNGSNIEVDSGNKQRYIGLVAKYYVVDRVKEQSEAFTRGLWEVIDRSWLRIFNEPELQVLISGASDGKVDVDDLRANTKYAGGYSGLDRNIGRFWSVISRFDNNQQQALLRFVTSCERPPPLGFASMNPPFTIQRVGITRDDGKLPTSSTCFNTLKLPIYSSEKVMKERLLYAIQSGAGFELT